MHKDNTLLLVQDLLAITFSVLLAVYVGKAGILENFLAKANELEVIGAFIAGMFFTSMFTIAPAIVALGEISQNNSLVMTAVMGAAGAVLGDLVIFHFIRDRFSEHVMELANQNGIGKRIKKLFKNKILRRSSLVIGGLIIASPLPDELGIGILGASKMSPVLFALLSFGFNFIGIIVIGLTARALI
jgi:hypothetical protein